MSLFSTISNMYDATGKQLVLDVGAIGDQALSEFFTNMFGGTKLTVQNVNETPKQLDDKVVFTGTSDDRLLAAGTVGFEFRELGQAVVAVLSVSLNQSWRFSTTFTELSGTIWDSVGPADDQAVLLLASTSGLDPVRNVQLTSGIQFYGNLDFSIGILKQMQWMYNLVASPQPAFGPIGLQTGKQPEIAIRVMAAELPNLFTDFHLPIDLQLVNGEDVLAGVGVASTFQFGEQEVTLSAMINTERPSVLHLNVDMDLALPSSADIAKFFGIDDLVGPLPSGFQESVHISHLGFGIGLGTQTLEYAKVVLSAFDKQMLTVVPEYVLVGNLNFLVNVYSPMREDRDASFLLSGMLDIAGVDLIVTARLPKFTIAAFLDEGSVISLTDIAKHFGLPDGAPEVDIIDLSMSATPDPGAYSVQLTLMEYPMDVKQGTFNLNELMFNLEYDPSGTRAELDASITIAGVDVSVTNTVNKEKGWEFHGQTGEDQEIQIGQLIGDLVQWFGVTPPDTLKEIVLKNLDIRFTTATKEFHFGCEGLIPVGDSTLDIITKFDIEHQEDGSYDLHLSGQLKVGSSQFELDFDKTDSDQVISASWKAIASEEGGDVHYLTFADIASALGFELPEVPDQLDLNLKSASLAYDITKRTFVVSASSENYGDATFVAAKIGESWQFAFRLGIPQEINLSKLPLVGEELSKFETVRFGDLHATITSASFDKTSLEALNKLVKLDGDKPAFPTDELGEGVSLFATMDIGGNETPLSFTLSTAKEETQPKQLEESYMVLAADEGPTSNSDNAKWFNIQKSLGPVTFKRIGVKYEDQELYFLLDAMLAAAGLSISLEGLSVSSKLSTFEPHFHIDGLGIAYHNGPVDIAGAFLARQVTVEGQKVNQYDGLAVVKAASFGLSAVGSYATLGSVPSLFVFINVTGKFGGPPYLFITGFSGGFGYNRSLRMPSMNEVFQFPFLKGLSDPDALGGSAPDPLEVLDILEGGHGKTAWVTPQLGAYWLALGVEFTSFQLLKTNAMVVAVFGNEFQLAVMGLSSLKLPQDSPITFGYVELQLQALLRPAEGFFGASAVLSPNSYLLDKNCHLTGGFAFNVWFDGDHQGDFVVTVGGYHPAFTVPDWYPNVPRLGFDWRVGDNVTIKGGAYFALTPSCIMAGGDLEVLFHLGNLRAWFTAYANFLAYWKPFHFTAEVGISVGVSYKLDLGFVSKTFKVELSADVELWGPPFGGKAHVDWYIISFTVGFGEDPDKKSNKLDWSDFQKLLPDSVCNVRLTGGLVKEHEDRWFVRADEFAFVTDTAIPATEIHLPTDTGNVLRGVAAASAVDDPVFEKGDYQLDIRPMAKQAVASTHSVKVKKVNGGDINLQDGQNQWALEARTSHVPEALWGQPLDGPPSASANLLEDRLIGLQAKAPTPQLGYTPGVIDMQKQLQYETIEPTSALPLSDSAKPLPVQVQSYDSIQVVADTLTNSQVTEGRKQLFDALKDWNLYQGGNDSLEQLAQDVGSYLTEPPMYQQANQ